jgi:hypothetical protein
MQHNAVVRLSWVPGTLNRVRMQDQSKSQNPSYVVSLSQLERVLGRPATFDLYLKGHISLALEESAWCTLTGATTPLPA